jgi:hypothetical protein
MRSLRLLFILLFTTLAGCSISTQNYRPSLTNVQSLRSVADVGANVGTFTVKDGDESRVNNIKLRGSTLTSPYGSFASYIEAAVREELNDAAILQNSSPKTITGMLLKNSLDANGFSMGSADIEVQFTVTDQSNRILYQKIHSANHEWPSSFVGAVAIPAAQQNYHQTVQKLLANLFADKEFITAIKKS